LGSGPPPVGPSKLNTMADSLYLSLWYPNLLLDSLAEKLTAGLGAFAAHGGESKVYSVTVWPVKWSETPVFERVYGRMAAGPQDSPGIAPREAVEEALELLHDDYAYEFQIGWSLWELDAEVGEGATAIKEAEEPDSASVIDIASFQAKGSSSADAQASSQNSSRWVRSSRLVRVTAFGPLFDEGSYEQDGHIRVDFGSDAPFLEEGVNLYRVSARHVEENVRQLVELASAVEKASGATARLLWSELGESLAQRLAERLGLRNA
jgi:hypothetical protein